MIVFSEFQRLAPVSRLLSWMFALTGFPITHEDRLSWASLSLEGLALGDAFGQMFSTAPKAARSRVKENRLPPPPWWRTDDTEMALAIVEVLNRFGRIDQDALAQRFAERFDRRTPATREPSSAGRSGDLR
jgi:ADP-ribosylglycohydrolase